MRKWGLLCGRVARYWACRVPSFALRETVRFVALERHWWQVIPVLAIAAFLVGAYSSSEDFWREAKNYALMTAIPCIAWFVFVFAVQMIAAPLRIQERTERQRTKLRLVLTRYRTDDVAEARRAMSELVMEGENGKKVSALDALWGCKQMLATGMSLRDFIHYLEDEFPIRVHDDNIEYISHAWAFLAAMCSARVIDVEHLEPSDVRSHVLDQKRFRRTAFGDRVLKREALGRPEDRGTMSFQAERA